MAEEGDLVLGFAADAAPAPPRRSVKRRREKPGREANSAAKRASRPPPSRAQERHGEQQPPSASERSEAARGAGAAQVPAVPQRATAHSTHARGKGPPSRRLEHSILASSRGAGSVAADVLGQRAGAAPVVPAALLSGTSVVELGVQGKLVTAAARTAGLAPRYSADDPSTHGVKDFKPSVIQALFIPPALTPHHTVGVAPTGSGKTLAFALPLLQHLLNASATSPIKREHGTYAMVITPTRELALQVGSVLEALATAAPWLCVGVLTGGTKRKTDKARLRKGLSVVVATPGRLLDHLQHTSSFRTGRMSWLVLDEFDRLLDMGFSDTISAILAELQKVQTRGHRPVQVLATSATLPPACSKALDTLLQTAAPDRTATVVHAGLRTAQVVQHVADAEAVGAKAGAASAAVTVGGTATAGSCDHHWAAVNIKWRMPTLMAMARFFVGKYGRKALLFLSTRDEVSHVTAVLKALWPALSARPKGSDGPQEDAFLGGLHGGMEAGDRRAAWAGFAAASHGLLVATDVAARGLDVPAVHVIVQCALPSDPADYVHRAGRTARMGRRGMSILLLQPHEKDYLKVLASMGVQASEVTTTKWLKGLVGKVPPVAALPEPPPPGEEGEDSTGEETPQARAVRIITGVVEESEAAKPAFAAACAAKRWQVWHECWVGWQAARARQATAAYTAYTRAYSTHDKRLKAFLHVKALHLGHVAKAFGLRNPPTSAVGAERTARAAEAPAPRRSDGVKSYARRKVDTLSEFAS